MNYGRCQVCKKFTQISKKGIWKHGPNKAMCLGSEEPAFEDLEHPRVDPDGLRAALYTFFDEIDGFDLGNALSGKEIETLILYVLSEHATP